MKHKLGIVCMLLGGALLLGAFGLLMCNRMEASRAKLASEELMARLDQVIEQNNAVQEPRPVVPGTPAELLNPEDVKMTEVEIDGYSYIGYLSIPVLGLELPVMAEWDYERLKIAPCRYYGTVRGEDLVLLAHNYRSHFGALSRLQEGDEVVFVDMDKETTVYAVAAMDVVEAAAVEEVIAGDFDLTLFTCTYGGQNRIVAYCDIVKH